MSPVEEQDIVAFCASTLQLVLSIRVGAWVAPLRYHHASIADRHLPPQHSYVRRKQHGMPGGNIGLLPSWAIVASCANRHRGQPSPSSIWAIISPTLRLSLPARAEHLQLVHRNPDGAPCSWRWHFKGLADYQEPGHSAPWLAMMRRRTTQKTRRAVLEKVF